MGMSVTDLKKSSKILIKKLEKDGLGVNVEYFTDPTRGGSYGGSYVDLEVYDEDGNCVEFKLYSIYGRTSNLELLDLHSVEYSGQDLKWSDMKCHMLKIINHNLVLSNEDTED